MKITRFRRFPDGSALAEVEWTDPMPLWRRLFSNPQRHMGTYSRDPGRTDWGAPREVETTLRERDAQ